MTPLFGIRRLSSTLELLTQSPSSPASVITTHRRSYGEVPKAKRRQATRSSHLVRAAVAEALHSPGSSVTSSEQRTGCSAGHLQIQQSRRSRTRTGDPFITRQRRVRHGRPRETTEVHKVPGKRPIRSPWVQTLELARARPYVPDSYPTRPRRRAGGTSLPGTETRRSSPHSRLKSAWTRTPLQIDHSQRMWVHGWGTL